MAKAFDNATRARLAIVGFAGTLMGFFNLLWVGTNNAFDGTLFSVMPFVSLGILVALVAGFALIKMFPGLRSSLRKPQVATLSALGYVVALIAMDLLSSMAESAEILALIAPCLVAGIANAFLLCSWMLCLSSMSGDLAIAEICIGSALGAAASLAIEALGGSWATFVILPVCSLLGTLCLFKLTPQGKTDESTTAGDQSPESRLSQREVAGMPQVSLAQAKKGASYAATGASTPGDLSEQESRQLSSRVIGGTVLIGIACGLLAGPPFVANFYDRLSFQAMVYIIFICWAVGVFRFYGHSRTQQASSRIEETSAQNLGDFLNGAYRLAIYLLVAGCLVAPLLFELLITPSSVAMAGSLGLFTVFYCIALAMGKIAGHLEELALASIMTALFAGMLTGLIGSSLIQAAFESFIAFCMITALGGALGLYSYFYLFTSDEVTLLVTEAQNAQSFDDLCQLMASRFNLSARESEILPLALRGRTNERMAQELYKSKNTVETHLRRIYGKCGVKGKQGLIDLSESLSADRNGV